MGPSYERVMAGFNHHALSDDAHVEVARVREEYGDLASWVWHNTPGSPERTTALDLLRQSKDAAVMAIVLREAGV